MLKVYLSFALFISGLLLQNCSLPTSDNLQSKPQNGTNSQLTENLIIRESKIQLPSTGKAKFNGISFSYNSQIFSQIIAEETIEVPLQNETDKPDSVMPKHVLFTIKFPRILPFAEREGTIEIIPIEDYRRMYAVSDEDTKLFDKQLQIVRKEVRSKSLPKKDNIPILPFWDGQDIFTAKVKRISFQEGQGIFWLRQWSQDFGNLFNNEKLTFMYQGISDDDKYYILAEFPLIVSFLPENEKEFKDYKPSQNYIEFEKHQKEYENYVAKIIKRLNTLPQNEFEPNLDEFEKVISSFKIEK